MGSKRLTLATNCFSNLITTSIPHHIFILDHLCSMPSSMPLLIPFESLSKDQVFCSGWFIGRNLMNKDLQTAYSRPQILKRYGRDKCFTSLIIALKYRYFILKFVFPINTPPIFSFQFLNLSTQFLSYSLFTILIKTTYKESFKRFWNLNLENSARWLTYY